MNKKLIKKFQNPAGTLPQHWTPRKQVSTEENPVYPKIDKELFVDGKISITPIMYTDEPFINLYGREEINNTLDRLQNKDPKTLIATAPDGRIVQISNLKDNNKLPAGYVIGNEDYEKKLLNARKKLDYIGGDHVESNLKFYEKVPSLINVVDSLSSVYGIDVNLMLERLAHEGLNSNLIWNYNDSYNKSQQDNIDNTVMNYVPNAFTDLGLDRAGEHLGEGHYNMRWTDENLGYSDKTAFNEKGEAVGSIHVPNLASGLEIKAAHIEYLNNIMKKRYPNATKEQLNTLVNAAYNLGEYHKDLEDSTWINENYTVYPWMEHINKNKQGGHLISKHAKGNPINTNPLPKDQINDNPVPKKKDKKKLFEIDQRIVGNIPPQYLTFPKGNGRGLYMIKRNE